MNSASSPQRGFTLVEMLVSVTILSFMLIMMAKITGLVEMTWHQAQNRIDNYTKARSMLDLISNDLQRAVFRGDLPIFYSGSAATPVVTNTGLYYYSGTSTTTFEPGFYTRLPAASGTSTPVRDVSFVYYAINLTGDIDKIALQRSAIAVPWTSGSNNLNFQGSDAAVIQSATASPTEVSPGVVGFHLIFRRADGTLSDQTQYTGYSTNPVVAVNVGLAVLNQQCLTVLSTSQISTMQGAFNSTTQIQAALTATTPVSGIKAIWDQQVLNSSFYASYPSVVGDGLKTYECWVGCTPF